MPDPDVPKKPLIVVTVAVLGDGPERDLRQRRNALYAEGVRRAGGEPRLIDAGADALTRSDAFAAMDGLLLSGGADIDPARYGQGVNGSTDIERPRDGLEAAAFDAADARRIPVLGICRGFQAINVFRGGTLLQDVAGHAGPGYGIGRAWTHELRVDPASRLGSLLGRATETAVNTYHHQGVRPADLAPGLVATAWADSPAGVLIEGLEDPDDRFVVGVQCHPERTESTPPAFEALWRAFVEASRADRENVIAGKA